MPDDLDEVSAAVLEHCREGNRLAGLSARHPTSTVYRKVGKLVAQGLLTKDGDVYRTTDRGREALGSPVFRSSLDRRVPQLAYAPTPVHRAVLELTLAAVVVRRHGARVDHHAALVVLGPTLTWKTWSGKMACAILGLDPVDHIVLSHAESGRSLLTRRGFAGTTVSKRAVLSAALVVIDEFQKADENTRRMADIYLSGSRVVSYENERLHIRPVPLFAMNPLEGDTLETRTGFDAARLRRCIIADFSRVVIPSNLRPRGEEFLANARKAGSIALADLRPGDCAEFRDAVTETLERCLVPDARARVDEELIMQIAEGMAAFIPPAEAWLVTVRDLLTVWETLGWTSAGWRLRLSAAEPKAKATRGRIAAGGRLSLQEETRRFLVAAGGIPRDLGLAKLIEAEKGELKAKRAELAELHRRVQATPKQLAEFVEVRRNLQNAGLTWDHQTLLWATRFVATNGSNADAVARLAYDLFTRGVRGGDADLMLRNLPSGMAWEQAMAWLGNLTRRYGSLEAAVAAKVAEEKAASGRAAEAKAREEQIMAEAGEAQAELNRIRTDLGAAEEKLAETRAEVSRVTADVGRLKAEDARLHADLERTKDKLRSTEASLERRRPLAALYHALEAALLGHQGKARKILRSLGADVGGDPVRFLRELIPNAFGGHRAAKRRGGRRATGSGSVRRRAPTSGRGHPP